MENQENTLHNELKRKSIFLKDYTTELYASGATTIRIEKNLGFGFLTLTGLSAPLVGHAADPPL